MYTRKLCLMHEKQPEKDWGLQGGGRGERSQRTFKNDLQDDVRVQESESKAKDQVQEAEDFCEFSEKLKQMLGIRAKLSNGWAAMTEAV